MSDNQSSSVPSITDEQSRAVEGLRNHDIHALVATFVQSESNALVRAIVALLDKIAAKADLQRLINELLSTLTDRAFYNALLNGLKAHIEAHPWQTAFFVTGIILMCNPLAMVGFGSLGPVAGKVSSSSAPLIRN